MKKAQICLCYFQPATNQIDHKAGKQNLDQAISPSDGVTCKQGTTKSGTVDSMHFRDQNVIKVIDRQISHQEAKLLEREIKQL